MSEIKDAKIIASIYNVFVEGSAKVAGGYVRDLILARKPNDIDVIIQYTNDRDYDEARILANRLGYDLMDYGSDYSDQNRIGVTPEEERTEQDLDVRRVFKLSKLFSPLTIDLVFVNCTVQERISRFPCSISKAWLEGSVVHTSSDFRKSVQEKVLYFTPTATHEYVNKMTTYFPEYKQEHNGKPTRD
jgi:hypothetical protein